MLNKKYAITILFGILVVLSLSAVGGAAESSDYDYERNAPANASMGDTIEVTIDVHTEGEVIEEVDQDFYWPKIIEHSADEAYIEDGDIIASFDEPGTLTYTVEVGGSPEQTEYNITAAGSLEAPETVIKVTSPLHEQPVQTKDLLDAISDWQAGQISTDFLLEIITAWQEGESLDCDN